MDVRHFSPIELVQNSALSSILLWRFGRSYQEEKIGELPSVLLFFLVLPLLLHSKALSEIASTYPSSGLGKLISKLGEDRENLLAIHDRALAMRSLTLEGIGTGVSTNLLAVVHNAATVRANEATPPKLPEALKAFMPAAEKLGRWFARVPAPQVFSLLGVHP